MALRPRAWSDGEENLFSITKTSFNPHNGFRTPIEAQVGKKTAEALVSESCVFVSEL